MSNELDIIEPITFDNIIDIKKYQEKEKIANIKLDIERRYARLNSGYRRPSLEYTKVEDIRAVFSKYVIDIDAFDKLTDTQLQELYDEWCRRYSDMIKESGNI